MFTVAAPSLRCSGLGRAHLHKHMCTATHATEFAKCGAHARGCIAEAPAVVAPLAAALPSGYCSAAARPRTAAAAESSFSTARDAG